MRLSNLILTCEHSSNLPIQQLTHCMINISCDWLVFCVVYMLSGQIKQDLKHLLNWSEQSKVMISLDEGTRFLNDEVKCADCNNCMITT